MITHNRSTGTIIARTRRGVKILWNDGTVTEETNISDVVMVI